MAYSRFHKQIQYTANFHIQSIHLGFINIYRDFKQSLNEKHADQTTKCCEYLDPGNLVSRLWYVEVTIIFPSYRGFCAKSSILLYLDNGLSEALIHE